MNKFLVLGEARSGTTSIAALLGRLLETRELKFPVCGEVMPQLFATKLGSNEMYEFIHEKETGFIANMDKKYQDFISEKRELLKDDPSYYYGVDLSQDFFDHVVEVCVKNHCGMKELVRSKAFSTKLLKAINKFNFKCFHTNRKNLLSTAISIHISRQTQVWNLPPTIGYRKVVNKQWREKIDKCKIEPLEIDPLMNTLIGLESRQNFLEQFKNENWMTINFYDLYSAEVSIKDKAELFKQILDSIGLDVEKGCPCCDYKPYLKDFTYLELVEKFFGNEKRVTTESTYKQIPNINEILSHFNSSFEELCERI